MNKADLINEIARKSGLSKADVKRALEALFETVKKSLSKGQSVTLVGFGTFAIVERKARKGRNPQTGKEIKIPARKVAKFRVGKELRNAVR